MTSTDCPCTCHGHGAAHQPDCSVPGGCGHLHRDGGTGVARCACGRPSPDAFLCASCTGQVVEDLTAIGNLLPELRTTLARQDRTRRGRPTSSLEPEHAPPAVLPAHLRTSHGPIALVAQPLPIDAAASDVAHDARNTLSMIWRDLCESRGIDIDVILRPARTS